MDRLATAVGAMVLGMMAAWPWGVVLYMSEGNITGAIGAFVVPPIGVLHAIGAF